QDYRGDLRAIVGSFGPTLKRYAVGEDDRPLELGDDIKSISSEETFLRDTDDRKVLRKCLQEQAAEIAAKLKRKQLGAHTVQVKVRYSDFTTLTRQISTEEPLAESADLYRMGCFLLAREKLVCRPLRLLGLIVTRGVGGLGLNPNRCKNPSVIIIADKIQLYPPEMYERGLDIITVPTVRNLHSALNPAIKSLNYLNNILAKIEANNGGCEEAIMLNAEGYVAECTGDNIFIIKGDELFTPPLSAGALYGITRGVVIDLARQ